VVVWWDNEGLVQVTWDSLEMAEFELCSRLTLMQVLEKEPKGRSRIKYWPEI
jgi:hypothetical protein